MSRTNCFPDVIILLSLQKSRVPVFLQVFILHTMYLVIILYIMPPLFVMVTRHTGVVNGGLEGGIWGMVGASGDRTYKEKRSTEKR